MERFWRPAQEPKKRHLGNPECGGPQAPVFTKGYNIGAEAGTRTPTPEGTAPSRQRVYQFHHFRIA